MNILKRFINCLFGKRAKKPVPIQAIPYVESVEAFKDLQEVAKVIEHKEHPANIDMTEARANKYRSGGYQRPRSMTEKESQIYYGQGYKAFEEYKKLLCQ